MAELTAMKWRSFLTTGDLSAPLLGQLVEQALLGKSDPAYFGQPLLGKTVGLLFFNASLRTRTSMAVAIQKLGGHAMILDVAAGVWKLETEDGVVMAGDKPEHIKEAIPVLSRYVDMLGVRCFSDLENYQKDRYDPLIKVISQYATVPVINLESAMHHPCQALADMMTIKEKLGDISGQKIVLSWAPHPKPLPMAVANSFVLSACQLGADLHITNPKGFDLDQESIATWRSLSEKAGGRLTQSHDQKDAFKDAKIVYAKSWGALDYYGRWPLEAAQRQTHTSWTVDQEKMDLTSEAWFMHCLPVRRNVVVTDEVIDGPRSCVIDQAENRLHGQKAVLAATIL